ncbi:uncharacterized protein with FMN-binding domain [Jatrophihabitans sp. GAS493]|uniref:FMN-binding protein n=1 Tax=Jatrophihabitans sp. GAS493 TaxID=1907575 RepID=UPI000BB94B4A|nr:FMN-binding protein [Jatrophihabitans sp. GAS493]SOD73218.1 uncharacterized protein with FMN-binding domain [Jatrophihabitans sp. GAS493]
MKRILFSFVGTIAALVALLSFKTHSPLPAAAGSLPSAAISAAPTPTPASSTPTSGGSATGAPPDPTPAPTPTSTKAASKTTVGSAVTTRYGVVQVKVVTTGSVINSVAFVQLTAFDGRSQQINSYAAPTLLQETINAQSANIDGVSGATYTSDGYRQSLQSALDQAGLH